MPSTAIGTAVAGVLPAMPCSVTRPVASAAAVASVRVRRTVPSAHWLISVPGSGTGGNPVSRMRPGPSSSTTAGPARVPAQNAVPTGPDGTDPDGADPDGTDPDGADPDGTGSSGEPVHAAASSATATAAPRTRAGRRRVTTPT